MKIAILCCLFVFIISCYAFEFNPDDLTAKQREILSQAPARVTGVKKDADGNLQHTRDIYPNTNSPIPGTTPLPANVSKILVGWTYTFTFGSPQLQYTCQAYHAYMTWLTYINSIGGVTLNGTQYFFEMIIYNDGADCTLINILTERLITVDNVDFMFASIHPNCHNVAQIPQNYSTPYLNGGDFSLQISPYRGLNWTVGFIPLSSTLAYSCISTVYALGARTYSFFNVLSLSPTLYPIIHLGIPAPDFYNISYDLFDLGKVETEGCSYLNPFIDNWIKLQPDILIGNLGLQDAPTLLHCLNERLYHPDIYFYTGGAFPLFRVATGWEAYGHFTQGFWDVSINLPDPVFGTGATYSNLYFQLWNITAAGYDAHFANTAVVATKAIMNAQSFEKLTLLNALNSFNEYTFYGNNSFTNGTINQPYLCFQENDNGSMNVVYPTNFQGAVPAIYPYPFKYDATFLYERGAPARYRKLLTEITIPTIIGGLLIIITVLIIAFVVFKQKFIIILFPKTIDTEFDSVH